MSKRKGRRPAMTSLIDQHGHACRSLKLKPTYANLVRVRQYAGTRWGRFYLLGWLTQTQHDAATAFAEALERHDRAIGLPSRTARSVDLFAVRGAPVVKDMTPRQRADVNHYKSLIARVGHTELLIACAIEDEIKMIRNRTVLAHALDKVAAFLQIERKEAA